MRKKKAMRVASLAMMAGACIFMLTALSNPTLGSTLIVGAVEFGAEQWRFFYAAYLAVMIGLFVLSFADGDGSRG